MNIYIEFRPSRRSALTYGICGQEAFKNARANLSRESSGAGNNVWSGLKNNKILARLLGGAGLRALA